MLNINTKKCCTICKNPPYKYFSIDLQHGFCGESCIRKFKMPIFRLFEPNLTGNWHSGVEPCFDHGSSRYNSTVNHGLQPISVTLDMYSPPFAPETKRIVYSK